MASHSYKYLNEFFNYSNLAWVGKQFAKLRVETAGKTDKRIRLMSEIVNGMKVIKMYCWEKPFSKLVHESRQ